jgi:hypothetical protein
MTLDGDAATISLVFAHGKKMAGAPKSWGNAPAYQVQAMPGISLMWQAEGASSSLSVCPRTLLLMERRHPNPSPLRGCETTSARSIAWAFATADHPGTKPVAR